MIRILSYKEHPRGKEILDRYLYLAAYILPFLPEDVLGTDRLEVDGQKITAENFCQISGKRARQRRESYVTLLKENGIGGNANTPEQRLKQDYLLAIKLIRSASEKLYAYLYQMQDVNVCPYCNRMYTMTLTGNSGKSRPQFDHYKNKSKYPWFAVSLMNLIPCCGLCNQSKHDRDEEVLYPYSNEMGLDVLFRTRPEIGFRYLTGCMSAMDEFSVELNIVNDNLPKLLKDKINNSDEIFHLTELYNKHKDYILYLFWNNYVFNDEYLEELHIRFPQLFQSLEDVKKMVYLMDISQRHWGRRPLGKLTHDIDQEIREMRTDVCDGSRSDNGFG